MVTYCTQSIRILVDIMQWTTLPFEMRLNVTLSFLFSFNISCGGGIEGVGVTMEQKLLLSVLNYIVSERGIVIYLLQLYRCKPFHAEYV